MNAGILCVSKRKMDDFLKENIFKAGSRPKKGPHYTS
jgi:hypothetical protein